MCFIRGNCSSLTYQVKVAQCWVIRKMTYKKSNEDRANLKWFDKDLSRGSLRSIKLKKGSLRGLYPFKMSLDFPITAIAGANGTGKSTLLALAGCAYHNKKKGFKRAGRKNPYYTFSDFFIQSSDEVPPQGIIINYEIGYDSWSNSKPSIGTQTRKKSVGGKWNNYDTRVNRNVAYFGVSRVVPHFERSAHKSYRSRFKSIGLDEEIKNKIALIAGRVIGKKYDSFESHKHSKYSLPKVSSNGLKYSGFNMGAGESAVFEILTTLFTIGKGALIIIDEIELGLHEKAQYRFIEELKKICLELKCQIICSTHSYAILSSLPPEGRMFIEAGVKSTHIIHGISPEFACGKMGKRDTQELDIFVEDGVAKKVIEEWLTSSLRKRINIVPIGSHVAVVKMLATRYLENKNNCLGVLDGDQKPDNSNAIKTLSNHTEISTDKEKADVKTWAKERILYLPSNDPPEKWLISQLVKKVKKNESGIVEELLKTWGLENKQQLIVSLDAAIQEPTHSEFHTLSEELSIDRDILLTDIIRVIKNLCPEDTKETLGYINDFIGKL